MNSWLQEHIACPIDHSDLTLDKDRLVCKSGHIFPYIDETPIMLVNNVPPTHETHFEHTRDVVLKHASAGEPDTAQASKYAIDPFVQKEIAATCGISYQRLIDNLKSYPIPELQLDSCRDKVFLEIGCNWGRWCIAAAQKGFTPVGIDPYFDAIQAAKRVARALGVDVAFLVADGRYLPFKKDSLDVTFSYSVLQHFDKEDTKKALAEIRRVLKREGRSLIQMLNVFGLRSQYNILRRHYKKPESFEVRYWTPGEIKSIFEQLIGPTDIRVDGFFSANPQKSDIGLLSPHHRLAIYISFFLKAASRVIPPLKVLADSLYAESRKA